MIRSNCIAAILGLTLPVFALAQDAPAPVVQAEPEQPALIQIAGVETLVDYAAVSRLLDAIEGVRRVDVIEAEGATVTFRVTVRGGSSVIGRALETSSQLTRADDVVGRLVYQYRR
jgi:hypothetical protein